MKRIARHFNSMEHVLVAALVLLIGVSGYSLLHAFGTQAATLAPVARIVLPG